MRIGAHDLDLGRGTLLRDGQPVHLRAKTFALLTYLARNAGRVIGKDELLDAIWPDVTVGEDSLTQAVSDLRRVLDDGALRTIPRRGYMLDLPRQDPAPDGPPAVVVLPFLTLSDRADDSILADAVTEEICQCLGRYGLVRVIARHSAFQCRPENMSPHDAARTLGADWFVEGSARRVANGLRLAPALCETATGRQIWADTFLIGESSPAEVLMALPHQIITRLGIDQQKRIALGPASPSADLGAWQHFVAGVAALRRYGKGVNEEAHAHFRATLARDPGFALGHSYLGLAVLILGGYDSAPPAVLDEGLSHALRGVELAPEEARCHAILALARLWRRDFDAAEFSARKAVATNPSDPDPLAMLGYVLALRGKPHEGIDCLDAAVRLNPLHPGWYHGDLAIAHHIAGNHAQAIACIQRLPGTDAWKQTRLAACHAALGDAAAAARHLDRAEALSPGFDALSAVNSWAELEHDADRSYLQREVALALDLRRQWKSRQPPN
ncbi:winged helix-turn-helix domain-containing tetratricopeptide repeat protein [Paragemmobacter straminiformis]|uniref:Winged helix-turn-helix domain-containing protein n=1 Tax=Paragemmobacter straminiformis TaxID=2045119 RepID=A0A842I9X9_9RHOB|nr:winged helix-turn-helix domain-containing protein [Gemmobacter straminiformis]MBC2836852.1 winged helix-turn-helix domain-containing protein [Gemmobacter straminiformis]